jgi:16S rRNA (uracil1498-N3)-methyltransferase
MSMRILADFGQSVELHQKILISPEESKHVLQVMRCKIGDPIELIDTQKHLIWTAVIQNQKAPLEILITGQKQKPFFKPIDYSLDVAITKQDSMEWVIEKAVELGCAQLQPIFSQHTVIKTSSQKDELFFQHRWQKIADQALKQCERTHRLTILTPVRFQTYIESLLRHSSPLFWCDETADVKITLMEVLQKQPLEPFSHFLIGPEGGFSDAERILLRKALNQNVVPISLGSLILRAETAAVYTLSLLHANSLLRS